jgi:hypothetical protein
LVSRIERFCNWSGLSVNVLKSEISAFDHRTGLRMATDAVLYKGSPFAALDPETAFTYLGTRITLSCSWRHEKAYIIEETRQRLQALTDCALPRHSAKAEYVKIGIAPVFQYSAGLVPWSDTELEQITSLWAAGCRAAWGFPMALDSAAMRLTRKMAGKASPSARVLWMKDVESLLAQCTSTPGLIAEIVALEVSRTCQKQCCQTLPQLQRMLRLPCVAATSVLELFVRRCDQSGLDLCSVFCSTMGSSSMPLISEVLWPSLWEASLLPGTPVSPAAPWSEAKVCVAALQALASAGLLTTAQLRATPQGAWRLWPPQKQVPLPRKNYHLLLRWLDRALSKPIPAPADLVAPALDRTTRSKAAATSILVSFDVMPQYGPACSLSRTERILRAQSLGRAVPPEVLQAVLLYPDLASAWGHGARPAPSATPPMSPSPAQTQDQWPQASHPPAPGYCNVAPA